VGNNAVLPVKSPTTARLRAMELEPQADQGAFLSVPSEPLRSCHRALLGGSANTTLTPSQA